MQILVGIGSSKESHKILFTMASLRRRVKPYFITTSTMVFRWNARPFKPSKAKDLNGTYKNVET